MTRIAVFKPFNIRKDSAFFSGQHGVFRYLQEKLGYQVTYFIEGETAEFSPVGMRFLHRNKLITLMMRILRKLFSWQKYYWKIPYYSNLDFSGYDIIITEGMHYLLLDYVKHVAKKVILNDSISSQVHLPAAKIRFLKTYFTHAVVVTVNEKIPGIYKAYGLDFKATAIGHAVSVEQIPFLARTASKGKLVSVGRLAPEKGFAYIIEAVSQLQKKYPAITLDIYGEGPLHKNLVELIHALKLENTVFLRGTVSNQQLAEKLQQYDLFISHPLEISYIAEAFCMANMEAMAAGLPVVTAKAGGVPFVVKDKAVVVEQKNVGQMVEAVSRFIDNPGLVEQYSREGRQYVEKQYSLPVVAAAWHEVIQNVIHGRV